MKDFNLLISLGLFNDALMNEAIYMFRHYESSSLEYTGISKHAPDEDVGLFSTVISRTDFEQMAAQQRDSMASTTHYMPVHETIMAAVHAGEPSAKKQTSQQRTETKKQSEPVVLSKENPLAQRVNSIPLTSKVVEVPTVSIGDKVKHKKFGIGIVTAFNGTAMDIKFHEGQKTLSYPFVFENNIIEKL